MKYKWTSKAEKMNLMRMQKCVKNNAKNMKELEEKGYEKSVCFLDSNNWKNLISIKLCLTCLILLEIILIKKYKNFCNEKNKFED